VKNRRLPEGGRIDRARPISFQYAGRAYQGYAGDTIASALLANGVDVIGRSFKRHRPRGLLSLGIEEPNAVLNIGRGRDALPNRIASEVPLAPGVAAWPTRGWPSPTFDIASILGAWPAPLAAGFYYKTFMGPGVPRALLGGRDGWNRIWEPVLRRMAGQGTAPTGLDPDAYDHMNIYVDVAVVGAGLAGLAAANAAASGGASVALVERDIAPGGRSLSAVRQPMIDGGPADIWAGGTFAALSDKPGCHALLRTTAFGLYDQGYLAAVELPEGGKTAGRIWHIRARKIVLATGAMERPMVFPGNDRPGVKLASAMEAAIARYAIRPGARAVIYANHQGIDGLAAAFAAAGIEVAAQVAPDEAVTGVQASRGRLISVDIAPVRDGAPDMTQRRRVSADMMATSGGWTPALQLHVMTGGRQRWDPALGCFVADGGGQDGVLIAGAAAGQFQASAAFADGAAKGAEAACVAPSAIPPVQDFDRGPDGQGIPIAPIAGGNARKRAFVDMQHDVTVADLELATREGFTAIEHAKRYTTAGMATDQGRTAQVATAAVVATSTGRDIGDVGVSGLRPPVTPVPFGALGGRRVGPLFDLVRKTPTHARQVALGAVFEDVGQWKRARYYPRASESMRDAVARECAAVRMSAGALDVSTLGKIDVQGPDAAEFMNRIYTNRMDTLKPGRCRYGLMLKDDGMVFDDGVVARITADRYHLTTTSGNAAAVMDWLEDWLQTEWPHLRVRLASVTEQWAGVAVAGPDARRIVASLASDADLSNEALPHLAWMEAQILGGRGRIFRVSFSGEMGFEINVPWRQGQALWDAVTAAGATPYGTEAMHVLRAEKGFIVVGHETDGTVTPHDLGMGWIVSSKKADFIGKRGLMRPALVAKGRKQLVGLEPEDASVVLDEGAQIIADPDAPSPAPMLGHVTSSYWSAALERGFAMALIKDGAERHGDRLWAWSLGKAHPVRVRDTNFYDVEGARMHG
jgi:sarcosine oxidase subunit alpha